MKNTLTWMSCSLFLMHSVACASLSEKRQLKENGKTNETVCMHELNAQLKPGLSDGCLQINDLGRSLKAYLPGNSESFPRAAIVVLHGGGGSGAEVSDPSKSAMSVFRDIADRDNLLIIYPEGSLKSDGRFGWNDCRADDKQSQKIDDLAFLEKLILQLRKNFGLKKENIFMAGTSNGAMMTFRVALEKPELIAAFAASSGGIAAKPLPGECSKTATKTMPILLMNGTNDSVVPAQGGCVAQIGPRKCTRGTVKSTDETLKYWLENNGLTQTQPMLTKFDTDPSDGTVAEEIIFNHSTTPLHFWKLHQAGHAVASIKFKNKNRLAGLQSNDVEFAQVAWNFFKKFVVP